MMRKILVVGDAPAPGGRVLPYDGPMLDLYGHRVALIGGRAYCEGCNSVGIIAKAGGPRRPQFISEAALEGDVVVCHCPVPQVLVSVLQQSATYDDADTRAVGTITSAAALATNAAATAESEMAAFKKTVDDTVTHPPEAEQTENMCPNMTNKEFATMALRLRDTAVDYITKQRLPELSRWDKEAQARVKTWFGIADQGTREYLQKRPGGMRPRAGWVGSQELCPLHRRRQARNVRHGQCFGYCCGGVQARHRHSYHRHRAQVLHLPVGQQNPVRDA